jgi:hypothetical protein
VFESEREREDRCKCGENVLLIYTFSILFVAAVGALCEKVRLQEKIKEGVEKKKEEKNEGRKKKIKKKKERT